MFRTLGFILSTLGSVPSNVFTVVLGTLNTFDGTDPKVDRVKPKVRNTIFFPVAVTYLGLGTRLCCSHAEIYHLAYSPIHSKFDYMYRIWHR